MEKDRKPFSGASQIYLKMENEILLREFMQKVWNEKDFDSITNYVSPAYTIYNISMVTLLLKIRGVAITWQYCSIFDVSVCAKDADNVMTRINTFFMIVFF